MHSPTLFFKDNEDHHPDLRLICFHYAGGGSSIYQTWQKEFPTGIQVCPVQLPGRENRFVEQPLESLSAIIAAILPEMRSMIRTPFAFFGYSMGALIAFELARELFRQYQVSPTHLFVSAKNAPHLPLLSRELHRLSDSDFTEELRKMQGTPEILLQNEELMKMVLPRIRADFKVCETYQFIEQDKLKCPLTVFGGTHDPRVSVDALAEWGQYTEGDVHIQLFEGNHFFIHEQQSAIISAILNQLKLETQPYGIR
ncbi:thioesterase II family protein [Paenibacillus sp. 481]|uniref:thioesterase II family protein n=1 Tax=Paenibacillus sp. 481 TaxID=2835869 RepID=UPI001E3A3669|nr:thioesterase domain-containing protein [Paenibacillus sp. 481]UHA73126.1 thioesterase [Paenibacillus sp. 481]